MQRNYAKHDILLAKETDWWDGMGHWFWKGFQRVWLFSFYLKLIC